MLASQFGQDNLETWHIGPNKVLVAFAPVKIKDKPTALKQFNADVREHFASFKSDDVLSLDQFMDEATSEDGKGFEPASPENLEETVMLRMIIQDLLKRFMKSIRSMVVFSTLSARITPKDRFLMN